MSTASKGKTYERELVRELRDLSLVAERVPRSVADAMPGPIDDVICLPSDADAAAHDDRPITTRLQELHADGFAAYLSGITQIEVKYSSSGAYGSASLLDAHKRTVGLGTCQSLVWPCGVQTGGLAAFAAWVEGSLVEEWVYDHGTLPSAPRALLDSSDAAAIRASGEPWVVVWELKG